MAHQNEFQSILWIDDALAKDDALVRLLQLRGYSVDCASTGAEGLELARTRTYRAALLDLGLPDQPGLSVLRILAAESPHLPIVIVTGYAHLFEFQLLQNLGASAFQAKPVDADEVVQILERLTLSTSSLGALSAALRRATLELRAARVMAHTHDQAPADVRSFVARVIDLLSCIVAVPDVSLHSFACHADVLRSFQSVDTSGVRLDSGLAALDALIKSDRNLQTDELISAAVSGALVTRRDLRGGERSTKGWQENSSPRDRILLAAMANYQQSESGCVRPGTHYPTNRPDCVRGRLLSPLPTQQRI